MKSFQFGIRHLLLTTLIVAVATIALQFCAARFSWLSPVAIILAFVLAIAGVWGICFSMLCAFAILVSEGDDNRRDNLWRCLHLSGIGVMATLPMGICVCMLRHLLQT